MDIGMELKIFRTKNRVQAQMLARHAEISPFSISRIENGWKEATHEFLDQLYKGYTKLGVKAGPFIKEMKIKAN